MTDASMKWDGCLDDCRSDSRILRDGLPKMTAPTYKKKPPTKDGFFRLAAYGHEARKMPAPPS
jgi:hypothetical protein